MGTITQGNMERRRWGGRRLHLVPFTRFRSAGGGSTRLHERSLCGLPSSDLTRVGGNPEVCEPCQQCHAAADRLAGSPAGSASALASLPVNPLPGAADEPVLPGGLDMVIDPEYWSLSADERAEFLREADRLDQLIDAAYNGAPFDRRLARLAETLLAETDAEPDETILNVVDPLPSLDGDWPVQFGEQGADAVLPPERQGVLWWVPGDDDAVEDDAPTDEELQLLAAWWVDFVVGNADYRWDYSDFSVVPLRSRRADREAWLVVGVEWDAGVEGNAFACGCYPTREAALAAIGGFGFVNGSDVTVEDAAVMRRDGG